MSSCNVTLLINKIVVTDYIAYQLLECCMHRYHPYYSYITTLQIPLPLWYSLELQWHIGQSKHLWRSSLLYLLLKYSFFFTQANPLSIVMYYNMTILISNTVTINCYRNSIGFCVMNLYFALQMIHKYRRVGGIFPIFVTDSQIYFSQICAFSSV